MGNTAHVFDDFAPKLTNTYHIYGITRRGFGASSAPSSGYTADRLGDDVIAVIDSLKLSKPVLVGHSVAGGELSSVGSRYPDRIAGLVYLEAAYSYAFDDGKGMTAEAQKAPSKNQPPPPPPQTAADRASFTALQAWTKRTSGNTFPEAELRATMESNSDGSVGKGRTPLTVQQAIIAGFRKFTNIPGAVLAIYAVSPDLPPWLQENNDPAVRAAARASIADGAVLVEKQAKAFEDGVPNARVIRLPHAQHYIFLSNEADVLREMRAFLATLK
jgi:pimeloyl-ACP methyl ester carboxylesterase